VPERFDGLGQLKARTTKESVRRRDGTGDLFLQPLGLTRLLQFLAHWPICWVAERQMSLRHTLGACAALILTLNGAGVAQQYSFRHYGAAEGLQNLVLNCVNKYLY
jgi:hypothetical protein